VQGLAEDGDHMLNRTDVINWALDAGIHVSEKNMTCLQTWKLHIYQTSLTPSEQGAKNE
jgi:hypothetical protein